MMYKANYGFEFDTEEKVKCFNDGAWICYSGCKSIIDPPDSACPSCPLVKECMESYALVDPSNEKKETKTVKIKDDKTSLRLKDVTILFLNNFLVAINKDQKCIDEFNNKNQFKMEQYKDCLVTSIHIQNEDTLCVNVEL